MNSSDSLYAPSLARRFLLLWRQEWLLWALAWCVARGFLLVSFADVFGYGEELEKACAGKAMLDGLGVPHHQLAYHYFEGGAFVVSHLDALAFALLGESLLAVKLVALGLGSAMLWAGWRFCERTCGRNGARVFALLFIFAPASVQKHSLLTLGSHFQAFLFVALVLDATTRLIVERTLARRHWFQLGIAAGFGFYFDYQLALSILVAVGALAVFLRRDLFQRAASFGLLGLAVGLLPLFWMASRVGWAVFDIHGAEVVGGGVGAKIDLLRAFFISVFEGRGVLDWIALIALCAAPWIGFFALGFMAERGPKIGGRIVLAQIAVFLLAYLATSFTVGRVYHYFVLNRLTPLWSLAMLFTTIGAVAAWKSRRQAQRVLAIVAVAGLVSFGAIDMVRLVHDALATQEQGQMAALLGKNFVVLARTKGYVYPEYLNKIAPHLSGSSADKLHAFLHFSETCRDDAATPLTVKDEGIALALYGDGAHPLEEIQRELADAGIADPRGFYLGMGSLLRAQLGGDIESRVHAVESYPPPMRDALIEAIGSFGRDALSTEDGVIEKIRLGVAANLPAAFFVGVGRHMHDARGRINLTRYFEMTNGPWLLNRTRAEAFAGTWPSPVAEALMSGYGAAHHDRWLDPPPWWLR